MAYDVKSDVKREINRYMAGMLQLGKYDKIELSEAILELVDVLNDEQLGDYRVRNFLKNVAVKCAPKVPAKVVNGFAWLSRMVGDKKDPREVLKYVWYKDGYFYAGNGHIIARVPEDKLGKSFENALKEIKAFAEKSGSVVPCFPSKSGKFLGINEECGIPRPEMMVETMEKLIADASENAVIAEQTDKIVQIPNQRKTETAVKYQGENGSYFWLNTKYAKLVHSLIPASFEKPKVYAAGNSEGNLYAKYDLGVEAVLARVNLDEDGNE